MEAKKPTVYIETTVPNIKKVTAINDLLGYPTPKIVNPEEVIFDVLEQKN